MENTKKQQGSSVSSVLLGAVCVSVAALFSGVAVSSSAYLPWVDAPASVEDLAVKEEAQRVRYLAEKSDALKNEIGAEAVLFTALGEPVLVFKKSLASGGIPEMPVSGSISVEGKPAQVLVYGDTPDVFKGAYLEHKKALDALPPILFVRRNSLLDTPEKVLSDLVSIINTSPFKTRIYSVNDAAIWPELAKARGENLVGKLIEMGAKEEKIVLGYGNTDGLVDKRIKLEVEIGS